MPGALKDLQIGENGEMISQYDDRTPTPASTSMSKATPRSTNAGSPSRIAPWTNSQAQLHVGPSSARPSQARQRLPRQKPKKSFFDTDSVSGRENDPDKDDHVAMAEPVLARGRGPFDSDSVYGIEMDGSIPLPTTSTSTRGLKPFSDTESFHDREDGEEDDDLNPPPLPSAQVPAKKGILSFSSNAPSVIDLVAESSTPGKVSAKMRGESAIATGQDAGYQKPTDQRKSTRKHTGKLQLPALDLEEDNNADLTGGAGADPWDYANMPASRGVSPGPAKIETKKVRKKQQAPKHSNPPLGEKKRLTKPSKPSPPRENPARLRQKAKPSAAAGSLQEFGSTGSEQDHQDHNVHPDVAEVSHNASADAPVAQTKLKPPTRAKVAAKPPSRAEKKESSSFQPDSEYRGIGASHDDDDDDWVQDSAAESKTKVVQPTKKPPQTRSIATRSKAPPANGKNTKSGTNDLAKEKDGLHSGDSSLGSPCLPKQGTKAPQLALQPSKRDVAAKAQPKKNVNAGTALSASIKTSTSRHTRAAHIDRSSTDNPEESLPGSSPPPQPVRTTRQSKRQLRLASDETRNEQADVVRPSTSYAEAPAKQAQGHQRPQLRRPGGESDESNVAPDQAQVGTKSKRGTAQNINKATASDCESHALEIVKDKHRKAFIVPFGNDGPKTNGKPRKNRTVRGHDSEAQSPAISPDADSSDVAKTNHIATARNEHVAARDPDNAEIPEAQPHTASHMPPANDFHTQLSSSRSKDRASAVGPLIEDSERAGPSQPRPTPRSHISQRLATVSQCHPSIIPEEDEEQGDFTPPDTAEDLNREARYTVAGNSSRADTDDNDGVQFGDDSLDASDETVVDSAVLVNSENVSDSVSAIPTPLTNVDKDDDVLSPNQAPNFRRHAPGHLPDDGIARKDRSVVAQYETPAQISRQPKVIQQLPARLSKDIQPSQQTLEKHSLRIGPSHCEQSTGNGFVSAHQQNVMSHGLADYQQQSHLSHNPQSMLEKQATYDASHQPFMFDRTPVGQDQQLVPTEKHAVNHDQQPSMAPQPTRNQERSGTQQQTTMPQPSLLEQPVCKKQPVMNQQAAPKQSSTREPREGNVTQMRSEWQPSLEREAKAAQLPITKSFSQPGVGLQSAKLHIQALSSDFQKPPKRARLNGPASIAEPCMPGPVNQSYVPTNGFSSDDVFAPKQDHEIIETDRTIVDRLRGVRLVDHAADSETGDIIGDVYQSVQPPRYRVDTWDVHGQRSKDSRPGSRQEETPEQLCGSDLWRQSLMNRRAQRPVVETNDVENDQDDELESYKGVGEVIQKIATGVLRSLKAKEAAVHGVVDDYRTGAASIVNSILAVHIEERKLLKEEYEQDRLNYVRVLEDARSKIRAIGEKAEAFDIDSIAF